jgi:hypothetical protein
LRTVRPFLRTVRRHADERDQTSLQTNCRCTLKKPGVTVKQTGVAFGMVTDNKRA